MATARSASWCTQGRPGGAKGWPSLLVAVDQCGKVSSRWRQCCARM